MGLGERVGSLDDNRYVGTEKLEEEKNVSIPVLPQRNYSLRYAGDVSLCVTKPNACCLFFCTILWWRFSYKENVLLCWCSFS